MLQKNIFISHSWSYSDTYEKIKGWIDNSNSLNIRDYSISAEKKLEGLTDFQLRNAIRERIRCCSVVIVPTGIYSTYSDWITFEVETASSMNKPIIGVNEWGQQYRSSVVVNNADTIVGWNQDSIINAIRKYC